MTKFKKSTIIILILTLVVVLIGGFIAGFEITRAQERDNYISLHGERIRKVFASLDIEKNIISERRDNFISGDFKANVYVSIRQGIGMGSDMDIYFEDGSGLKVSYWVEPENPNFFDKMMAYYPEPDEYGYGSFVIYQQPNGTYMYIYMKCNYPDKAQSEAFWNFVSQQIDKAIADANTQEVA